MGNIHLKTSCSGGNISLKDTALMRYIGARAVVTRTEEGVKIWLSDYQGATEEIIAEAIDSIETNDDGSLTFVLPDGREITTDSLKGLPGEDGEDGVGIESIEKTGTSGLVDTYTITYTDGNTTTYTVTNGQDGSSPTGEYITDVEVDGVSVVSNGVAEITTPAETDPVFAASAAYGISSSDISSWDGKSEFSGSYSDLTDKPGNATTSADGFMSSTDKSKLDSIIMTNGLIDPSILPSYVDDVIEAYPVSGATDLTAGWLSLTSGGTALTPETGKIYILMTDTIAHTANEQFRWSGSTYVGLSSSGGEIYFATYGTTPYLDVYHALIRGQLIICNYQGQFIPFLCFKTENGVNEIQFSRFIDGDNPYEMFLSVNSNNEYDADIRNIGSVTQSDWAEADSTDPSFIRNKPPLSITGYIYPGGGKKIAEITLNGIYPTSLYAPERYVSEYGTDIYQNVLNAYDADRDIVLEHAISATETRIVPLQSYNSTTQEFTFSTIIDGTEHIYTLSNASDWDYDDSSLLTTETDPVFQQHAAYGITQSDISGWNAKSTVSVSTVTFESDVRIATLTIDGTSTNINAPKEIWYATYGTTTYAQLNAAFTSGMYIVLKHGSVMIPLLAVDDGTFIFQSMDDTSVYSYTCDSTNGWDASTTIIRDVIWATYGTTTSATIETAYQDNKIVYVNYNGLLYMLSARQSSTSHTFTNNSGNYQYTLTCSNDSWSETATSLIQTTAKGANNGVCPLNSSGKIDASYLPVYSGGVS